MRHIYLVFAVLLLAANTACAASFDCAKAGTKVEKMICTDAELSKLDEQLDKAYSKVLKKSSDPSSLKQQQRTWLKERDKCDSTICLRTSYEQRKVRLQSIQSAPVQKKVELLSTTTSSNIKFPPYPDVWEMHFPILVNNQPPEVRSVMLNNGDVWFGFVQTNSTLVEDIPLKDFFWRTFFGQQTNTFDENEELLLNNGIKVNAIEDEFSKNYPGTGELTNGNYIISSQGTFYRGCYQGPAANQLARYQSKVIKKLLQSPKVVFLLLDEPITISTGSIDGPNRPAACDAAEQTVTTRVVSMYGDIIPLKDDGFLLKDQSYGLVIRFDAHLNTQSRLLNKKIFVLESEKLDSLFIEKITGKNYMDERGWTKMQQAIDDLYTYLISLSKREK